MGGQHNLIKDEGLTLSIPSGSWKVSLPADLQAYQEELEAMLEKTFPAPIASAKNLPLAQQMLLNWCASKCRQIGIAFHDSWFSK